MWQPASLELVLLSKKLRNLVVIGGFIGGFIEKSRETRQIGM